MVLQQLSQGFHSGAAGQMIRETQKTEKKIGPGADAPGFSLLWGQECYVKITNVFTMICMNNIDGEE